MFSPDPTPLEQELYRELAACVPEGAAIEIPPRVAEVLPLRFVAYEQGTRLVLRAKAEPRYANPMGVYQGGILSAVCDVGYGVLAMLTAKAPCVSVTMETSFIRPLTADGQAFEVHVRVRAQRRTMVFLNADIFAEQGDLIAASSSAMSVFRAK